MATRHTHCHHCATRVPIPPLRRGEAVRCGVCRQIAHRMPRLESFQPACALAGSGLIFLLLANTYPIMTFSVAGNTQSNDIITGVLVLFSQGYWPIAVLVFFCAILAPALYFSGVAFVAACCETGLRPPGTRRILGMVERVESWSLVPVFAAACLVAVVKLDLIGSVYWQVGVFWVFCLSLCSLALGSAFNTDAAAAALRNEKS
jgi:paraquat-inducible protein A